MICKTTRIKTGGAGNVVRHVQKTFENEEVHLLEGDPDDIEYITDSRAAAHRRKYSVRHTSLSPDQELSPEQEKWLFDAYKKEWGAEDRDVVIYRHIKGRSDGSKIPHYHVLINEVAPGGRVLDNKMMFGRNEKISRLAEIEFGHDLTKGRHNKAVMHALMDEGKFEQAAAMDMLTKGSPALSRFSSTAHQIAKRHSVDLAAVYFELGKFNEKDFESVGIALAKTEKSLPGLKFEIGDNGRDLVMKVDGEFICSMNRMLKMKAEFNNQILFFKNQSQNKKDISHDKQLKERREARAEQWGSRQVDNQNPERRLAEPRRLEEPGGRSPGRNSDANGDSRVQQSGSSESNRPTDGSHGSDGSNFSAAARNISQLGGRINKLNERSKSEPGVVKGIHGLMIKTSANKSTKGRENQRKPKIYNIGIYNSAPASPTMAVTNLDDPAYVEKAAAAWLASIQNNGLNI